MGKIEKLLDRTRRNGETKKWKMYVFAVVGILVVFGILFGLILFAEVDEYLNSKTIIKIYDAYDKKIGKGEDTIYYLGDSTASYSIYPPLINEKLSENGFNFTLFGVSVGNEAPLMRVLQLQNIIDSKPAAVFYALSYRSLSNYKHWIPENIYLVHDKLKIRDDSLYLYTENEIEDINHVMNFFDKRTFLSSAMKIKLNKIFSNDLSSNSDRWHDTDGLYYNLGDERASMQHSYEEIVEAAKDPLNSFRAEIIPETNRNKEALLYFAKTLADNDIPLVFICAPINPIMADEVNEISRQNVHDFFNSTGATWYDMEYSVNNSDCFVDVYHLNEKGALQFSNLLSDIILQELT